MTTLLLASLCVMAVQEPRTPEPIATLDFQLLGGRIYLPAELAGHATSVILDTGATASVMDLALAEEWKLPTHGEVNVNGVGDQEIKGKFLAGAEVALGGLRAPVGFALPLGRMAATEGRRLEVVLGQPFFDAHVIEVDYAERRTRIFDDATDLGHGRTALPLRIVGHLPHVSVALTLGGTRVELDALVDSGSSGSDLTGRFTRGRELGLASTAPMQLNGGVMGPVEGRLFRPETLEIGGITLSRPVLAWVDSAGGATGKEAAYDAVIGADVLRRFRVTYDYPHERLLLEPGPETTRPFEADKTGLRLRAEGADLRTFVVIGVLAGSSAEASGVRVDDVIESVDGAPAERFSLQELRELFRSPDAPRWKLVLRRGDQRLPVELTAKSIV